jgi:hypothetical protein
MNNTTDSELLNRKQHNIQGYVGLCPVAATEFSTPDGADSLIVNLEADLRVHGELEIEVEERGEVELHCGNTEFDYDVGVVKIDSREEVLTIPFDRICGSERHYDL